MANKQQTAVEILVDFLNKHCNPSVCDIDYSEFKLAILQAKEIEKQQIIDACGDEKAHLQDDGSWRIITAEQYYKETYEQ